MKKLTREQWETLNAQYQKAPDYAESGGGEHWVLISVLNKLGHYPRSRQAAMTLADRLLRMGWDVRLL